MPPKRRNCRGKKSSRRSLALSKKIPGPVEVRANILEALDGLNSSARVPGRIDMLRTARRHFRMHKGRMEATSLFHQASNIPSDLGSDDHDWMYDSDPGPFIPPWRQSSAANPEVEELSLTLSPNCVQIVRDSCPASPLYIGEVPDSEPENSLDLRS